MVFRSVLLAVLLAVASVSASSDVELSGKYDGLEGSLDTDLQDHVQDKATEQAKTRWQWHLHRHHRHRRHRRRLNGHDCSDIAKKFQTVDAKCNPTQQAFAAARAMVRFIDDGRPNETKWELLHHCGSLEDMAVTITVGSSDSNTKKVSLPTQPDVHGKWGGDKPKQDYAHYMRDSSGASKIECPAVVSKKNWGSHDTYPDTFSVDVSGMSLTVKRNDGNGGWGMNLVVKCTVLAPDWHLIYHTGPTKDWRLKGSNPPFGCIGRAGTVSCPCTASNGQPMNAIDAQNHIITQVTGNGGRVRLSRKAALLDRKNWGVPYPSFLNTLKSTVAVAKMIHCWRKKCASPPPPPPPPRAGGSREDASTLDLSLGTYMQWGGGVAC